MLGGKRILLIIGGGIAAYKTLDLIRRLRERGAHVRAILTKGGAEFVTPLSVSSLTGEKVYTDLFDLTGVTGRRDDVADRVGPEKQRHDAGDSAPVKGEAATEASKVDPSRDEAPPAEAPRSASRSSARRCRIRAAARR